jgi:hypothetical protein
MVRPQVSVVLKSLAVALLVTGAVAAQQREYEPLNMFSLANFNYREPSVADVKAKKPFTSNIPAAITALNGKKVSAEGFMIPFEQSANQVTEFMLVADFDACQFGEMPARLNDWIHVTMRAGKVAYYSNSPIVVNGILSVGEEFDRMGYVNSIFRIDAVSVQ